MENVKPESLGPETEYEAKTADSASPRRVSNAGLVKDVAIGAIVVAIGICMMILSTRGSLLFLGGSDICVSATKTLLKKIPILNPLIILYPVLIILSTITYFADASQASFYIFSGLLAKSWTKSLKNMVKGQPFVDLLIGDLPLSIKRRLCPRLVSPKVHSLDENEDDVDDDEDDDREWNPPSWRFQVLLIGSLVAAAGAAYLIPLLLLHQPMSIAAVYLVNAVAKTITVALRHYPILPAVLVGAFGAAVAALCDYATPGLLPIALFPPSALFSWQIVSDPFQLHLRGKPSKRPFCSSCVSGTPKNPEIDHSTISEDHPVDSTDSSGSKLSRIGIVGAAGGAMLLSNIVQPTGGLFPQAMTGSFSAIFTKGVIGKPKKKESSLPRLIRVAIRTACYGAAVGVAYGVDLWIHSSFETFFSSFNMTLAFVIKMATSKEIKEVTRLDYDGLCHQNRDKIKYSHLNEVETENLIDESLIEATEQEKLASE